MKNKILEFFITETLKAMQPVNPMPMARIEDISKEDLEAEPEEEEPTKLQLRGANSTLSPIDHTGDRTVRTRYAPVSGRPTQRGWRA